MVIWLIGLAGAGKTSIGRELYARLKAQKPNVVFLDGDDVRAIMGADLGHTLEDRRANGWRVCRLCQYLDKQGLDVVCAILSLFQEHQDWNRVHYSRYFEVYVQVSMEVLIARDQKGLYSRARAGEISDVAGIDLPFTPPARADLVIQNNQTVGSHGLQAERILAALGSGARD